MQTEEGNENPLEENGYIIIPARNEAENLPFVFQGIIDQTIVSKVRILLSNNGSTDHTEAIAREWEILVINEPTLGYGSACLAALEVIQTRKILPEWVLITDGDGSDDPKDMRSLLKIFHESNADLVIGSRILGKAEKGSLSPIQIFGNKLTCFLILIFYGRRFTDMGSLRVIRYSALEKMKLIDKTWGWNIEMQIRAMQEDLKILEIPVNYRRRKFGTSKISGTLAMSIRVGVKILFTFFRLSLSSTKAH
jgi:glycosyltransferase involved in cell wall biosynthesis